MTLPKPPHGQPCNSCGLCCRAQLCPLGARLFGKWDGPCPALEPDGDKEICGLVANPGNYAIAKTLAHGAQMMREAALCLIGSGVGCDAQDYNEPADESFRASLRRTSAKGRRRVEVSLKLWGVD